MEGWSRIPPWKGCEGENASQWSRLDAGGVRDAAALERVTGIWDWAFWKGSVGVQ